ncbi:MAG: phytase [Nocardioidaceae bacterium]|nr:phytase [Nocardioidaceae bacterium]
MMRLRTRTILACLSIGLTTSVAPPVGAAEETPALITADGETKPVGHSGDAADDPTLWVHSTNPAASLIIGNDKQGALRVYNLDGSVRQQITTAKSFWGNSDVRQQVTIAGRTRDVVAAVNGGLRVFTVTNSTRMLRSVTDGSGSITTGGGEGLCLYHSQAGQLSAFVVARSGRVRQFQIVDKDTDGLLEGILRREFFVGSEAEGCVVDDVSGELYVAQEDVGLWRYGADFGAGTSRVSVDKVGAQGHLAADVEGVTLVDLGRGTGYLIASAQNVSNPQRSYFTAYDRKTNAYAGSFRVVEGAKVDGCERTDGIAAYAGNLGQRFPEGMFICQDNNSSTGTGNQNFKLVRLEKILRRL